MTAWQTKYLNIKRVMDLIAALFAIAILSPLFLLVAIILKIESPKDTVIFKQDRVGQNNKIFTIYKFRTMVSEAPHELSTAEFLNAEEYITGVGRFLRKTSLDELPQLFNIVRGDMSILGPRPLILSETEAHEMRNKYNVYLVRPGLSGLAQIHGRDALNDECKVLWDRRYVENIGFRMDLSIFLQSFAAVLSRAGVMDGKGEKEQMRETKSK